MRAGPRWLWVLRASLAALLAILAPGPAVAQETHSFLVDPRESWVELAPDSRVGLDFGLPSGDLPLPLSGQHGALRTPVRGTLVLFRQLVGTPFVRIEPKGILLVPANSGPALPGLPGTPDVPASAQLAATFADSVFGISGDVAVRELAFELIGTFNAEEQAPGDWSFPVVPQGFPPPRITTRTRRGVADVRSMGFGESDRVDLAPRSDFRDYQGEGRLEELGEGRLRVTLPFEVDLANQFLPMDTPLRLGVGFRGEIVAYSPTLPVPEPGAPLLGLAVVASLAWVRSRRLRAPGGRSGS